MPSSVRSFEYLRKDLAFLRLLKLLLTTSMAELVTTVTQMCVVAALMSWRRSTLETSSAALLNGDRQARPLRRLRHLFAGFAVGGLADEGLDGAVLNFFRTDDHVDKSQMRSVWSEICRVLSKRHWKVWRDTNELIQSNVKSLPKDRAEKNRTILN